MAAISNINSNYCVPEREKETIQPAEATSFYQRSIKHLTAAQEKLDHLIPNFSIQNKIDYFLQKIEETFQSVQFKAPLDAAGNWKQELARFLAGFPKKVAINILNSLKSLVQMILQGVVYTVAHPMKAPLELAKKILLLAKELSQPDAWIRIGANTLGSSLGYLLITPNPLSPIAMIIGAALVTAGISITAIKAALDHINPAKKLISQGKTVVEEMATGLCFGLLLGGIQRAVHQIKQWGQNSSYAQSVNKARTEAAKSQAQDFLKRQNLPDYDRIRWETDSVSVFYDPKRRLPIPNELPNASTVFDSFVTKVKVIPGPPDLNGSFSSFSMITTETEMMGYKFAFQPWEIPPELPPVPPSVNLANQMPIASAIATIPRIYTK